MVEANPAYGLKRIEGQMGSHPLVRNGVVSLQRSPSGSDGRIEATIAVSGMLGEACRVVEVGSDTTIANMQVWRQENLGERGKLAGRG